MNHENAYLRRIRQKFEARFMRKSFSSASSNLENFSAFNVSRKLLNKILPSRYEAWLSSRQILRLCVIARLDTTLNEEKKHLNCVLTPLTCVY